MPFVAAAPLLWTAIAALAGTGYEVGSSIYDKVSAPNTSAELKKEEQAAANQKLLTEKEAVAGQSGNTQAQTGGSLTAAGSQEYADILAGYPGYRSTSTGTGSVGSTGTTTGTTGTTTTGTGSTDVSALLQQLGGLPGSTLTGGTSNSATPAATGRFELSSLPF